MWYYDFIIPDFLVLFVFLVFYFSKPRIAIRLNKTFFKLLILEICVLCLDVCGSLSTEISILDATPLPLVINDLYFFLFIARSGFFFLYTTDVLNILIERKKRLGIVSLIVFIAAELMVIADIFFPILFSIVDDEYQACKTYNLLYIFFFYFSFASFYMIYRYRKNISKRSCIAAVSYNTILLFGYCIRMQFPNVLVMDLFCITSLLIIYLSYENPDFYLEEKTGLFNRKAFSVFISEMTNAKQHCILGFVIHNYTELREIYGRRQMEKGTAMIGHYLSQEFPNCLAFYIGSGRFALISKDEQFDPPDIQERIVERFSHIWRGEKDSELFLEIGFASLSSTFTYTTSQKLVDSFIYSLDNMEKTAGAICYVTNDSIKTIEHSNQIKRAVEKAGEQNTVELFLQPLIDVSTNKVVAAEALARIRDEEGNLVLPGDFIQIAERNGRINSIGEQMFEKTCKFIHDNDMDKLHLSWINVNLSPIQFLRKDLHERFSRILQKYDVDASLIRLEITEESIIDPILLKNQIEMMRSIGFYFVLDDFGSGYSNVTRLKQFPFSNVKLDKEVVWDFINQQDTILPTIVKTFKQMHFTVTAEGVETKEIADAMKSIGCDYLQGFYYSKPLPSTEFYSKYTRK